MSLAASDSVYDYLDYQRFLQARLPTKGKLRGIRSRLALALGCQPAFVSQVVSGAANLSFEQAVTVAEFLGLSAKESHYFLLLVHCAKAGTQKLKNYYRNLVEAENAERRSISNRIELKSGLSGSSETKYYSSWHFAAIHMITMIPAFRTRQAIAQRLDLPVAVVAEAVEFLKEIGLLKEEKGSLSAGQQRIHLEHDSVLISVHHANWRAKSLQSLPLLSEESIRYSGAVTLSRKNAEKIREILMSSIESMEPVIADTGEEDIYGIGIDFYPL